MKVFFYHMYKNFQNEKKKNKKKLKINLK